MVVKETIAIQYIELSKDLFGRSHELTVWAHIADRYGMAPESFCAGHVQSDLVVDGVPRTQSWFAIQRLHRVGMVQPAGQPGQSQGRWFERTESAGWGIVSAALLLAAELDLRANISSVEARPDPAYDYPHS